MTVMVLGNGISRKAYDQRILEWTGEIWGCNLAYLEYGDKLSRLTGHDWVLIEAAEYLKEHPECTFRIWSGHSGATSVGFGDRFTCSAKFCRDSGTTLVAQALEEGHTVLAVGFDLGGWDIHSPGVEHQDKTAWVKRWRELLTHYGWDSVEFMGHDHKPMLRNPGLAKSYRDRYISGRPHLADATYLRVWEEHTGGPAILLPGRIGAMARVRFLKNGYETNMNETLALRYMEKGKVEIIESDEPKKKEGPKAEKPKSTKRQTKAKEPVNATGE